MIQILTPKEIGEQRRVKKISQKEMAELLRISLTAYRAIEEDGDPRVSVAVRATEILG